MALRQIGQIAIFAALASVAMGARAQAPLTPPADTPQPVAPATIAQPLSPPTSLLPPEAAQVPRSDMQPSTQPSAPSPSSAVSRASPSGGNAAALVPRTENGVVFVSGGVGDEELAALHEIDAQYNLRLLFAERSGAYLSGVDVRLMDQDGAQLIDAVSDGPYFLARVKPGSYRIDVFSAGHPQARTVSVVDGSKASEAFYWPDRD